MYFFGMPNDKECVSIPSGRAGEAGEARESLLSRFASAQSRLINLGYEIISTAMWTCDWFALARLSFQTRTGLKRREGTVSFRGGNPWVIPQRRVVTKTRDGTGQRRDIPSRPGY